MRSPHATENTVGHVENLRLEQMTKNVAGLVRKFCEPLFMVFDFQSFDVPIYEDIVSRFERGEVS
jgi:hypothetical protein